MISCPRGFNMKVTIRSLLGDRMACFVAFDFGILLALRTGAAAERPPAGFHSFLEITHEIGELVRDTGNAVRRG